MSGKDLVRADGRADGEEILGNETCPLHINYDTDAQFRCVGSSCGNVNSLVGPCKVRVGYVRKPDQQRVEYCRVRR